MNLHDLDDDDPLVVVYWYVDRLFCQLDVAAYGLKPTHFVEAYCHWRNRPGNVLYRVVFEELVPVRGVEFNIRGRVYGTAALAVLEIAQQVFRGVQINGRQASRQPLTQNDIDWLTQNADAYADVWLERLSKLWEGDAIRHGLGLEFKRAARYRFEHASSPAPGAVRRKPLNGLEKLVVDSIKPGEQLTGQEIADRLASGGHAHTGHLKHVLSTLVKTEHLVNHKPGYSLASSKVRT